MAYVMSIRPSSGTTPPESIILSETVTYELEEPFTAGEVLPLVVIGSGVLTGTLAVNYQEKLLMRGDEDFDYSFDGNDVTLNFGDDPTQYAGGKITVQISYAYYA